MSESAPFLRVWMGSTSVSEYGSYGLRANPASPYGEFHFSRSTDVDQVWAWQHNPDGVFTPFNPTITCEFAP